MKRFFLLGALLLATVFGHAQEQLLNVAREYLRTGQYEKAAATYKQLLDYTPGDPDLLSGYFQSLLALKDYKTAEKAVRQQLKQKPDDPVANFELSKLYTLQGEEKKAAKLCEKIIDRLGNDESQVRNVALMFERAGQTDHALQAYEKGRKAQPGNPYLFAEEMALLYDKKGDHEKAEESLLDLYVSRPERSEETKAALQRLMQDPARAEALRKKVLKRAARETEQIAFTDLLAWMYIQQQDYENAYIQIRSIDTRLSEQGRRMLGFARLAFRERQWKSALMAYDAVIEKGAESPFALTARSEKLTCMKEQLSRIPSFTQAEVATVINAYKTFLDENPAFRFRETLREYAELEARYARNPGGAIELLQVVVNAPQAERNFRGRCKLEMGDYELLRNNVWESTLLYSQVDKDFKQDMLGEEARFRNAKLSYYTGDFVWAQGQLDVLKASTSELIANDALNLSVLITENNPVADSNVTPLQMFARADLLSFQHRDEEALAVLDSITTQFPQHPLMDDILMLKADMSEQRHDYPEAAMYLQKVVTQYAEDILADDAMFRLAVLNEERLSNKDEAKRLFEQVIIKYPGSTWVTQARKRFRALRGDKPDAEIP